MKRQTPIATPRTLCYNNTRVADAAWMHEALAEAEEAPSHGDVPVGAVAVLEGAVVGRGQNRKEADGDPTAHAEMIALREAARTLGRCRLHDVTLYCTLEPCPMCAGALVAARVGRLVYGADDPKAGAAGSVVELLRDSRFNHQVRVTRGVLTEESTALLQGFFAELRSGEEGTEKK
jgi:tRNA(adenine34) deaminase